MVMSTAAITIFSLSLTRVDEEREGETKLTSKSMVVMLINTTIFLSSLRAPIEKREKKGDKYIENNPIDTYLRNQLMSIWGRGN